MVGAVLPRNLITPRLSGAFGPTIVVAAGLATMALACLALLGTDQGASYGSLVLQFVALGAGLGLLVPPLTSMLSRSGVASGVLNSMRQIGSVLGVALFKALIGTNGLLPGLRLALIISVALLALSATAMVIAARRNARPIIP